MFYSVDRFEEDTAVLVGDDEKQYPIPRGLLPPHAKEGDVVKREREGYAAAPEETARRKAHIQALLDGLPGR